MWQSLVQFLFSICLARGTQENWNFLGDDSLFFLRPIVSGSQLFGAGLPEECVRRFFWESTSGMVSVFSAIWVDSGYMFWPVYGAFWKKSDVFCVKVGFGSIPRGGLDDTIAAKR